MNRREAVKAALRHKQTPFVPYEMTFSAECEKKVSEAYGQDYVESIGNFSDSFNFRAFRKQVRPDFYVDDFGNTFFWKDKEHDVCEISSGILQTPDKNYRPVELDIVELEREFLDFSPSLKNTFCCVNLNFGLFERAWLLRGMNELLCDMLQEKVFVHGLFEALCEYFFPVIDTAAKHGFDGMLIGDDWGMQKGMIMGAPLWREMIRPYYKKLVDRLKSKGMFVIHHSCGDIADIFGDMIELGVDAYQTVQPEIYCLTELKKKYGENLSFWGGISTQSTLPRGSAKEVRECVAKTISILGGGGGYVCGPTHTICNDVPVENVVAFVETLKEHNASA